MLDWFIDISTLPRRALWKHSAIQGSFIPLKAKLFVVVTLSPADDILTITGQLFIIVVRYGEPIYKQGLYLGPLTHMLVGKQSYQ